MPRSKSYDAAIADIRAVYGKMFPDRTPSDGDDIEDSRREMMEEIRAAVREGLVSSEAVADEIINDILLNSTNPQDRLRAAELIKKSSAAMKGSHMGIPPGPDDLARLSQVITEVGLIAKAEDERRVIAAREAAVGE